MQHVVVSGQDTIFTRIITPMNKLVKRKCPSKMKNIVKNSLPLNPRAVNLL